jgi:ribosome biogenesis GTPase A
MIENINWYPGHMKKTRELIQQNLKAVDVVVEIIDARIPRSSRNPIIDDLVGGKKRIVVLGKGDLADADACREWIDEIKRSGHEAVMMNSMTGQGSKELLAVLERIDKERRTSAEGQGDRNDESRFSVKKNRPLRIMVVGVPNVGKSSFINRMTGKKSTKVGDRPGVTKGKQWLTLKNGMQLLDTPGILWPKFEDPSVGLYLAFCGSIKDEILDSADLALELIRLLGDRYPGLLMERYRLGQIDEDALVNMEAIAQKRGFIMAGKRIDYERTARTVLDEFRAGKIGRITLELP